MLGFFLDHGSKVEFPLLCAHGHSDSSLGSILISSRSLLAGHKNNVARLARRVTGRGGMISTSHYPCQSCESDSCRAGHLNGRTYLGTSPPHPSPLTMSGRSDRPLGCQVQTTGQILSKVKPRPRLAGQQIKGVTSRSMIGDKLSTAPLNAVVGQRVQRE